MHHVVEKADHLLLIATIGERRQICGYRAVMVLIAPNSGRLMISFAFTLAGKNIFLKPTATNARSRG